MRILIVLLITVSALIACHQTEKPNSESIDKPLRHPVAKPFFSEPPAPEIRYRLVPLNDSLLQIISHSFDSSRLKLILALNRIDLHKLHVNDTLIVPDTFVNDWNVYAPFPSHLPSLDSVHKIILCSYQVQAFAAYEQGKLVRWGAASLGKRTTPTPTGLFHANWKAKRTISTIDSSWILNWYFNLTNFGGVSLHQYELPGYPASHSCVRLKDYDAHWIYYWAEQWKLSPDQSIIVAYGTPVLIFGSYDYNRRAPWLKLAKNPDSFILTRDSINSALQPYMEIIMHRQHVRDSVEAMLATAMVAK